MRLKIPFILCLLAGHFSNLFSECVLVPLSLGERVAAASLIVEARVVNKQAYWNSEGNMIYTANSLQVSKVYKGSELLEGGFAEMITLGGSIGNRAIKVDPELETETGEIGIFMLVKKDNVWVSESGVQGFIRIDKYNGSASDLFNTWEAGSIHNTITALTGMPVQVIDAALNKISVSAKRAAVSISGISPKTLTAGTGSILTIRGSNFNSVRDTGSVQFRHADFGSVVYTKALKTDYISWSDTMIRVKVLNKAGTGKIRVVIGGNGNAVSGDTLFVSYAHLNVVAGDTIAYETRQIGMNANNGITWKMNRRFFDSTGARSAFLRSLERWRCGTYINWDTLGKVNYSTIKSDNVNICAWDTNSIMPSGTLAQCFSYWNGCFAPDLKWFVSELDIRFRLKPTGSTNWEYGTGNASGTEFHFESVATHELGHGHQLGHVISNPAVMHYSIANGQTKPGLNANDIAAGNYVLGKSTTAVCGRNAHNKLNAGNCAIVAPKADISASALSACKNETLIFKDSSAGNISSYTWNFGIGATPANASGAGPHNVSYGSGGNKTVTLSISTIAGTLQKSISITVRNDSKMLPDFSYVAAELGKLSFSNLSNNSFMDKWYFGDGDSSVQNSPSHVYNAGGTYTVRLISTNTCNTAEISKAIRFTRLNFGTDKNSVCIGEPAVFTDSSDVLPSTWNWSFPQGIPSAASGKGPHSVQYNTPGLKQATLTVSVSGGQNQSYTRTALINTGTDTFSRANFSYTRLGPDLVVFNNLSSGSNMNYTWFFGDGESSAEKNPVHIYRGASGRTVRLLVNGDCGNDDTSLILGMQTGLEHKAVLRFEYYPNPSNGHLQFAVYNGENPYIEISEMSGKNVAGFRVADGQSVDISALKAGIYVVKARFQDGETKASTLLIQ